MFQPFTIFFWLYVIYIRLSQLPYGARLDLLHRLIEGTYCYCVARQASSKSIVEKRPHLREQIPQKNT